MMMKGMMLLKTIMIKDERFFEEMSHKKLLLMENTKPIKKMKTMIKRRMLLKTKDMNALTVI